MKAGIPVVIPNRKAVRNLLFAVTTTTHVGTAASAVQRAQRAKQRATAVFP
ncbi:MAG: hypothetical protein WA416_09605 [Candidatus Sulfotelmatobacter sp.]